MNDPAPIMFSARKASYKLPPTKETQEARMLKLLAEQKKKRQLLHDSSRQLEAFNDLTIDSDEDDATSTQINREGVGAFAGLVQPSSGSQSSKRKKKKKNQWANKCMYAELLEMTPSTSSLDGLPADLDTAWTIISPVPTGKRCLAITHQSPNTGGMIPNTILTSRVVGKTLIRSFPSPLPPLTILDCILDVNWKQNGILHILDVLKWKGQDIASNEVPFRMWWRDARLSELKPLPPPASSEDEYQYRYPTLLSPIPWHTNFDYPTLFSSIIPQASRPRAILNILPNRKTYTMEQLMTTDSDATLPLSSQNFETGSDGLLIYISEASYESGSSPLSLWVPIVGVEGEKEDRPLSRFTQLIRGRLASQDVKEVQGDVEM